MRAALLTLGLIAAAPLALAAPAAAAPVPLAQIGSNGSAAGQLSAPSDVAVDGSGDVYVADTNNNRISVFAPDGTFIHAFGWGVDTGAAAFQVCTTASTCQAGLLGGGAGQLSQPYGLAFDSSGNLYVGGQGSHRIDVFDPTGPSFVRAFGWGVDTGASAFEVCTTASTCQLGLPGGGAGQFNFPLGVVLDSSGNLYVANSNNNRIDVFNTAGPSFVRAFGWGVDTGAGSLEVCTTASTCQAGIAGNGAGQLQIPYGVALDGSGNLYTVDDGNHRVSAYSLAGPSFTRSFGWGVDTGASAFEVCTSLSGCQAGVSGGGAGQLATSFDVAVDGGGNLIVSGGVNNRIDVFDPTGPTFTRAYGRDVAAPRDTDAFEVCTTATGCLQGIPGSGAGELNGPVGVTADCRGAVWVADLGNGRVQRFGEPGTPLPPCTSTPPPGDGGTSGGTTGGGSTQPPAGPTGQRAAALAKCKKKHGKARKRCKQRANKLPV